MPELSDDSAIGLLEVLCRHTVELLGACATPPGHIRVYVGNIGVELGWPVDGAAGSAPGAVRAPEDQSRPEPAYAAPVGEERPAARPRQEDTGRADPGQQIHYSPIVGTFYRRPEPGTDPFVELNDLVEVGQQLGILEAMKLMNPILAEYPGRIVAILAEDGESVEYAQPLFSVAVLAASQDGREPERVQ